MGAKQVKALAVHATTKVAPGRPRRRPRRGQGPARALARPGDREVPRARHDGERPRLQRAVDAADPQLHRRRRSTARRSSAPRSCRRPGRSPRRSCASCVDRLRAPLQGQARPQGPHGAPERLRARPDVRRLRPRRRARGERAAATTSGSTPSRPAARSPGRWSAPSAGCSTRRGCASATARRCCGRCARSAPARGSARCWRSARGPRPQVVGQGSAAFAAHVKGLELPGYEPRTMQAMALGMAVNARGADHNRSGAYEADLSGDLDRLAGGAAHVRGAVEAEDRSAVMDSMILCRFLRGVFDEPFDEWAGPAVARHRLGRRRPTSCGRRRSASCSPSGPTTCARAGSPSDDWLPERFLDRGADGRLGTHRRPHAGDAAVDDRRLLRRPRPRRRRAVHRPEPGYGRCSVAGTPAHAHELGRGRPAQVVALRDVAAQVDEPVELRPASRRPPRPRPGPRPWARPMTARTMASSSGARPEPGDEAAVDLHAVDREALQVGERGVAGAEVVDEQAQARGP